MKETLFVGAGAALGALARYLVTVLLGTGMIPLLLINACGSYAMGRLKPGPFVGTGFLGGFTSFSTFTIMLYHADEYWMAAIYLVTTFVTCVGAYLLGDLAHDKQPRNY